MDEEKKNQSQGYTDLMLKQLSALMQSVVTENLLQIQKWGKQTHTLYHWYTIIGEEFGSLGKAILEHIEGEGIKHKIFYEAIQVATLALKIAEMVKFQNGD